ncbi:MAG: CdaR family protein [Eubacteriales bacterium]|nr:CdaR family protein [Eubacteriales bacterium]
MDKIKNFFKTNIGLKLISFGIAVLVWIMVVNISNPEIRTSVGTDIGIDYGETLTKLDKYYSLDNQSARVSYTVRTNARNQISSSDFNVYVDMRDYSITGALPVYVTVNDKVKDLVSDVSVTPLVVHATTQDMIEKPFDLTVNIVGEPGTGYAVAPVDFTPSRVTLYGPDSEIGKISRIGFDIDVEGSVDSIWGTAEFVYYDANDNPISPDVRIVVKNSVSYFAPIYKKKNVSITIQASGEPAAGYEVDSVSCEPGFIEIYGDNDLLDGINAVILPSTILDVTGASSDVTASIDISRYLPDEVYTDMVTNVAVAARISRITISAPVMDSPNGTPRPGGPRDISESTAAGGPGGIASGGTETQSAEARTTEASAASGTGAAAESTSASGSGTEAGLETAGAAAEASAGAGALDTGSDAVVSHGASGTHESTEASNEADTEDPEEVTQEASTEDNTSN